MSTALAGAADVGADAEVEKSSTSSASARQEASTKKDEGGFFEKPAVKSFIRSAGTVLGREITRSLFGTKRRR